MKPNSNLPFLGLFTNLQFRKYLESKGYWTYKADLPDNVIGMDKWVNKKMKEDEDKFEVGVLIEGSHVNGRGVHNYLLKTKEGWLWDFAHWKVDGTMTSYGGGEPKVWTRDYVYNGKDGWGNYRLHPSKEIGKRGVTEIGSGGAGYHITNLIQYYRILDDNIFKSSPLYINWQDNPLEVKE